VTVLAALFHIVDRDCWAAAVESGEYRAASLQTEGFIHCSFADQVAAVANNLYRDEEGLCVVELDPARIGADVVIEDSYGTGTAFPHVYGPVPAAAAVAVHALARDANGDYSFTAGGAAGAASPDH
jgi:uncharacterized protein (DUF952 family)